jgi:hypothetical protein
MKTGTNILGRLRRWKTGGGRHVLGLLTVAYLSAGVAPCLAMAHPVAPKPAAVARVQAGSGHEGHAAHEHRDPDALFHDDRAAHATPAAHEHATAPADDRGKHCPHCFADADGGAAIPHDDDHAACSALEGSTDVAASQAKDAPQPAAPVLGPAPFTLPPPLASPAAPSRAVRSLPVTLNIRHCVFLI